MGNWGFQPTLPLKLTPVKSVLSYSPKPYRFGGMGSPLFYGLILVVRNWMRETTGCRSGPTYA